MIFFGNVKFIAVLGLMTSKERNFRIFGRFLKKKFIFSGTNFIERCLKEQFADIKANEQLEIFSV